MDSDNALELQDIIPAEQLLLEPGWPLWAWALIALAAILLVTLIVKLVTRTKSASPVDLHKANLLAYQQAMERIKDAATLPVLDAATITSGAIRQYLTIVSGDPSLFETHEEFISRHKALDKYPEQIRQQVTHAFSLLAQLKYDKDRGGDPASLSADGCVLLEALHQHSPA